MRVFESVALVYVVLSLTAYSIEAFDSYECPVCGDDGSMVNDCLTDCPGFPSTDNDGNCIDRKLFSQEFLWRDLLSVLVWFITAGISAVAGVGGGGIYVPAGILLLAFAPKQSSGLSQASTFGAAIGSLLLNMRIKHPKSGLIHDAPGVEAVNDTEAKRDSDDIPIRAFHREDLLKVDPTSTTYTRPVIDYDMSLFLSPMEMAGAVLGVLIQTLLPNWLYLLLAAIVLVITAYKTIRMYRNRRAKEHSNEEALKLGKEADAFQTTDVTPKVEGEDLTTMDHRDTGDCKPESSIDCTLEQRKAFLENDARQLPKEKVLALTVLWIGLLILTLLKGGNGLDSLAGITCKSPWYLAILAAQFFWMLSFALVFGFKLLRDQHARQKVSYPYLADDVVWDMKLLRFYGSFTFFAGIVAGLIGIGGGMVLGPLMLVMGIHPRVSSATTNTMVVLTSSSVAVIFVTSGYVPWTYAALFFSICLIGSILGQSRIDEYIKKTGRSSLIVLVLAVIIALAAAGCVVILIWKLSESNWHFDGFKEFCKAKSKSGDCAASRMLIAMETGSNIPEFMTNTQSYLGQ